MDGLTILRYLRGEKCPHFLCKISRNRTLVADWALTAARVVATSGFQLTTCCGIPTLETISKLAYTVTPAKAGVQNPAKNLGSGFRRNDDQRCLSHFEIVS
jgi:hypothetical protein